ncbi:MAG TPA: dTDP-4-dehydrorhamnose 3,5-epimerase family protein [Candidatus Elarobacter sp.]|jgi:dTDP-4-dehydrorhamnose 3,5-epimerase|nr:dTDP-4-dehydrorhamnose 3,5-epimerase family protein [Candidatus Elarobacter sp.]
MDVISTSLDGVWQIPLVRTRDERGWFVRTFDANAFAALGLETEWPLQAEGWNERAGTVRGLHLQREPHGEIKLIRCTRGAVYDVLVDVRRGSPTFGRWQGFDLSEDGDVMLYAPAGVAHGYQSLANGSALHYLLSAPYTAEAAVGYRFDSPALGIPWPLAPSVISARDRALPPFDASRVDA